MRAEVLTPWTLVTDKTGTFNASLLFEDYPAIAIGSDMTCQPSKNLPPSPNLHAVQIECDAVTLAAIEADVNYHVLWSDNA